MCGGESGIRTHGRFHVAGFQDRFLQPLGHLSILECPSPEHLWYITISPPPLSTGKRKFAPGNFLEIFQSFFQKRLAFWKKTCYYNQADFESSKQMNPGVAQLVAHLTGGQGVVSSSLATRTKKLKAVRFWAFFVPKNKMLPREKVFYNQTAAK